jgi:hypothetical protein
MSDGVAFLASLYDPQVGLLRESPVYSRTSYYLNTNALAAYTFETLGVEQELTAHLRSTLKRYGYTGNGFTELAEGRPIRWPPYHGIDRVVDQVGEARILRETHDGPGYFADWQQYSNLAFMEAFNLSVRGFKADARQHYQAEMARFDGAGWPDLAYTKRSGVYETLGLAWGVYAGARIGMPVDENVLRSLLLKQNPSTGGFHTHYRLATDQLADANVETTCIALLGLRAISSRAWW